MTYIDLYMECPTLASETCDRDDLHVHDLCSGMPYIDLCSGMTYIDLCTVVG